MFSSADESLKDETHLLLLWDGSLVTLHTLCSSYIFGEASSHIYGEELLLWGDLLVILHKSYLSI